MRIAILMANTDESAFAQARPKDGEKFRSLLSLTAPDWDYPVFAVKDGVFPDALDCDGVLITGSPASVHDGAAWMARLEALVRHIVAQGIPLYGVCFGHQIIAKALGGVVGPNPDGWGLGPVRAHLMEEARAVLCYAAHIEQVTQLPPEARITARGPGCPIAGFGLAERVQTTQYHPEMTPDFMADLLDAFADSFDPGSRAAAKARLDQVPDAAAWSARITGFFASAG